MIRREESDLKDASKLYIILCYTTFGGEIGEMHLCQKLPYKVKSIKIVDVVLTRFAKIGHSDKLL